MATDSALDVALTVADLFEDLGVDYLVGGSLASSLHGEPRATQDVDFVAALTATDVKRFLEKLGNGFYVDADRVLQSVIHARSFNVIHLETMFKVDVFVLADTEPARLEMSRRERHEVAEGRSLYVASAEDVVLQKLRWYRLGDEVSDRQWRDVLAVLRVNSGRLDLAYMKSAAPDLGVEDLLQRALRFAESGEHRDASPP